MAKILDAGGTYREIVKVIDKAEKYIVIIAPYLRMNGIIDELSEKDVPIVIICRDLSNEPQNEAGLRIQKQVKERLAQLPNCKVYECPNLHTKCYFNESRMVISSMNLYESTVDKNFEMGIRLESKLEEDDALMTQAKRLVNDICKAAGMPPVNPGERQASVSPHEAKMGYCIRCGAAIPIAENLDPRNFFCEKHYRSWSRYADPNYDETYCHICGEPDVEFEDRCAAKPICVHCWPKVKKNYK